MRLCALRGWGGAFKQLTVQVFLEGGIGTRALDFPVKTVSLLRVACQSLLGELAVTGHGLSAGPLVLMFFCPSSLTLSLLQLLKRILCAHLWLYRLQPPQAEIHRTVNSLLVRLSLQVTPQLPEPPAFRLSASRTRPWVS